MGNEQYGTIRVKLRELILRRELDSGEDVRYIDIQRATGISLSALVDWVNDRPRRFDEKMLVRLCHFFDCQIQDLLVYVPPPD